MKSYLYLNNFFLALLLVSCFMDKPKRSTRGKKAAQTEEEVQKEMSLYASLFG